MKKIIKFQYCRYSSSTDNGLSHVHSFCQDEDFTAFFNRHGIIDSRGCMGEKHVVISSDLKHPESIMCIYYGEYAVEFEDNTRRVFDKDKLQLYLKRQGYRKKLKVDLNNTIILIDNKLKPNNNNFKIKLNNFFKMIRNKFFRLEKSNFLNN